MASHLSPPCQLLIGRQLWNAVVEEAIGIAAGIDAVVTKYVRCGDTVATQRHPPARGPLPATLSN